MGWLTGWWVKWKECAIAHATTPIKSVDRVDTVFSLAMQKSDLFHNFTKNKSGAVVITLKQSVCTHRLEALQHTKTTVCDGLNL